MKNDADPYLIVFFYCEESISNQREFIKLLQSLYSHAILIDQNKKIYNMVKQKKTKYRYYGHWII
ncbi:hypothetical protein D5E87_02775 [Vibrio parahaemolyticus]|nr:hypothetical protein D5E87_02775 [Vibrio parahaemolyticus]TBT31470.1 hypothetical protein D5E80_01300 [Vibrio parahaemolyticus]